MNPELRRTTCCGLREFVGLTTFSSPEDALKFAFPLWNAMHGAFMLFTCPTNNRMGKEMLNFIKDNRLGSITESDVRHNPNSGNNLRVIIWGVNTPTFKTWFLKNGDHFKVGDTVKPNQEGVRVLRWPHDMTGKITRVSDDFQHIIFRDSEDTDRGWYEAVYFQKV